MAAEAAAARGRRVRLRPQTTSPFIATTLYEDAGIHLPASKATLVYSRLAKRLRALGLESFRDYCALVGSERGRGRARAR